MIELKTLVKDYVPSALKMAERYRLLNEPFAAESICRDILKVVPDNQDALITLLLSLTDKFRHDLDPAFTDAMEVLGRLNSQYCKGYYSGVIYERRANYHLRSEQPGSGEIAYQWFKKALAAYDQALSSCSFGNQDAVLRWNACARILNENPHVKPGETAQGVEMLDSWD